MIKMLNLKLVILLKYQDIKAYVPNWSEEVLVIKKVINTVPWTYAISDVTGQKFVGRFYKKDLQKMNQKESSVEEVLKRKDDKLYVKWKGYDSSFNSSIDKKGIV